MRPLLYKLRVCAVDAPVERVHSLGERLHLPGDAGDLSVHTVDCAPEGDVILTARLDGALLGCQRSTAPAQASQTRLRFLAGYCRRFAQGVRNLFYLPVNGVHGAPEAAIVHASGRDLLKFSVQSVATFTQSG